MIVYLASPAGAITACETAATVTRAKARGYTRCSRALFIAYWKRKDRAACERMAEAAGGRERAVGGWTETTIRRAT